jgi:hypothetical protein
VAEPFTVRLGIGNNQTTTLLETAPLAEGFAYVLRDVSCTNSGGGTGNLAIGIHAAGLFIRLAFAAATPSGTVLQWQGRQALAAGDSIFVTNTAPGLAVVATGYRFALG